MSLVEERRMPLVSLVLRVSLLLLILTVSCTRDPRTPAFFASAPASSYVAETQEKVGRWKEKVRELATQRNLLTAGSGRFERINATVLAMEVELRAATAELEALKQAPPSEWAHHQTHIDERLERAQESYRLVEAE
jgi:hypothetical protein